MAQFLPGKVVAGKYCIAACWDVCCNVYEP